MADRIAIMRDGIIEQIGTPHEVFARPANVFVASFIGTPQMNLIEAELMGVDGGRREIRMEGTDVQPARRPGRRASCRPAGSPSACGRGR